MAWTKLNQFYFRLCKRLYRILELLLFMGLWIFALYPAKAFKRYNIYQLYILLWYSEIIWTSYFAIGKHIVGDENSLNSFVSGLLYATHMLSHSAVLTESWLIVNLRPGLLQKFQDIQMNLNIKLNNPLHIKYSLRRLCNIVMGVLLLLFCGHGVIMWSTFNTTSAASLLYWHSLPSYLALQFKTLEFLTGLVQMNHYIIVIRRAINDLGERNLTRVFRTAHLRSSKISNRIIYVWSLQQEQEDEKQLKILKSSYNEVYVLLKNFNDTYSVSLLASTLFYFVDLVCNSYWILSAILSQDRDYFNLLQKIAFALLAFVLLTLICWFSEESTYESRYIGCLISKLVKPLGNKPYNDLVSEFSIQTLHQRFIITAKDFFSLNLNLLGSMVAAIVTYLVILIQFMFNERHNNGNNFKTQTFESSTLKPVAQPDALA